MARNDPEREICLRPHPGPIIGAFSSDRKVARIFSTANPSQLGPEIIFARIWGANQTTTKVKMAEIGADSLKCTDLPQEGK
jgi:hypothetical protein